MNPFMLAIKDGSSYLSVANVMAKMDPNLVTLKLNSGSTVSKWAQEKEHDVFFKVCCNIPLSHLFVAISIFYQTFIYLEYCVLFLKDPTTCMVFSTHVI